jgi:hypothetical protein
VDPPPLIAEFPWEGLSFAGFFAAGMVLGTIFTIRLFRWVMDYLKGNREEEEEPSS